MLHRLGPVLLGILLVSPLSARGARGSEAERVSPGADGNLNWVIYGEVAAQAADSKQPVMIYLYEGVKNSENVQEMVAAQLRLFTDADVQRSAASFICTKADRQKPKGVTGVAPRKIEAGGVLDPNGGKGDGDGEGGDDEGEDGFDPREDDPAGGAEPGAASGLIVDPKDWPDELCLFFVDYRGRPIQKISEITSKRAQFVSTVQKVLAVNAKRVKTDEREAEKEARKLAAEEARRAKAESQDEEDEGDGSEKSDGEGDSPADDDR